MDKELKAEYKDAKNSIKAALVALKAAEELNRQGYRATGTLELIEEKLAYTLSLVGKIGEYSG